jgi:hypothetical protein
VSGNGEDAGPYVAALAALGSGVLASMAVASATVPHRPVPRMAAPPRAADVPRALASLPAPLAITSYAEPAYVLESSTAEPAYRRQPAFYTDPIYLPEPRAHSGQTPPVRPEPASRPDLNRRAEPAPESTYEPPYEAPYESPYDPKNPPSPAFEVSAGYEPGHAVAVEAVVVEPTAVGSGPTVEDAVVVEPTDPAVTASPAAGTAEPVAEPAAGSPVAKPGSQPDGKRKGRQKDKDRRPTTRRTRRPDPETNTRELRQGERDHIDWIDNLVKLPIDPTLKMSKDR